MTADVANGEPGPPGRRGRRREPLPGAAAWAVSGRPYAELLLLAAVLAIVAAVRVALLPFPLERDEGEFAYIGQMILRGVPPYASAYTQKLPGTYLVYALVMLLFGESTTAIHAGFLLVNLACIALLYLLVRRFLGAPAALTAAGVFGVLALSPNVNGFAAHATFLVDLFVLAGAVLLVPSDGRRTPWRLAAAGAMFACAGLMKQPGAFFLGFGMVYVAWQVRAEGRRDRSRMLAEEGWLLMGFACVIATTLGWVLLSGIWTPFWFWAFRFAGTFVSQTGPSAAVTNLATNFAHVAEGFHLFWVMGALGAALILGGARIAGPRTPGAARPPGEAGTSLPVQGKRRTSPPVPDEGRRSREAMRFAAPFLAVSLLSIAPGFFFSFHYFLTLLPALAMCCGATVDWVYRRSAERVGRPAAAALCAAIVLAGAGIGAGHFSGYYFATEDVRVLSHRFYGNNPFPESVVIADYIRDRTAPDDRIAVIGSEPQIYFLSRRRSASRFVNLYFLTSSHSRTEAMRDEMIHDVEAARPPYIVFVTASTSWLAKPGLARPIELWFNEYTRRHYELVGIADIESPTRTNYRWEEQARAYTPVSDSYLAVFRRRTPS